MELSKDKVSYVEGEKAFLRARVASKPEDPNLEFELLAKVENVSHTITKLSEYEYFAVVPLPTAGLYRWRVDLYLQDKALARDLKAASTKYQTRLSAIEEELALAPEPAEEAALLAEKARLEALNSKTQEQLALIRTKIGQTTGLNIQVN